MCAVEVVVGGVVDVGFFAGEGAGGGGGFAAGGVDALDEGDAVEDAGAAAGGGFELEPGDGVGVDDGGFGEAKAEVSDLGSTYRVMRALMLLKEKPKDVAALRKFVTSCRNSDGGYGVTAGAPSSMSGVYYATIVSKWLDDMEK